MKQLENLISVKKLIALMLTICFIYLCITGKTNTDFLSIYTMIIGFYFGQSIAKSNKTE